MLRLKKSKKRSWMMQFVLISSIMIAVSYSMLILENIFSDNKNQILNTDLQRAILKMSALFAMILAMIFMLTMIQIRQKAKEETTLKHYYDNYTILLREMNCALIEYDIENNTLYSNETFFEYYGIDNLNGSMESFEKLKKLHPEFDFAELEQEILLVQQERCTHSFETIVELAKKEIRWMKIILVPISNIDEIVNKIIVILTDTTEVHGEFDKATEILEHIPSGLHRCYLSDPIHLEYYSDGLCKMMGYTREEFHQLVGDKYSRVIYEEDRNIFRKFVRELAAEGGTNTCEYRMVCKDGTLISVSDIMDAKRSSSGVMYGYSVVVDLTRYQEAQKRAEEELKNMKEQLEQTRIRVSTSQMQPHFLYNALASIRELVLEDPQYASDLIYDFTLHLRACIRAMGSDNFIAFQQELENIKAYTNIEKMRFGEKLKLEYDIEIDNFDIIPLSIQPLVENAIRHGIHERGAKGGTVWVRSYLKEGFYRVEVEDDGVGFDVEGIKKDIMGGKRDSTGLLNLIYRFEKLMNATVLIESKRSIGTKVTVIIPYREEKNEDNISR